MLYDIVTQGDCGGQLAETFSQASESCSVVQAKGNLMKTCLAACCSLALVAITSPAQDKPRLESAPKFSVGDHWVYKETDSANNTGFTVLNEVKETDGETAWLYGRTDKSEFWWKYDVTHAKNIARYAFDAGAVDKRGRVNVSLERNESRIQFPLEVGKTYSAREYFTTAQGERGDRDWKVTVESYEKVRTEAGEFDAYRISMSGWWNNRSNRSSGKVEATQWYAPAAKRNVKYQSKAYWQGQILENISGELMEFAVTP